MTPRHVLAVVARKLLLSSSVGLWFMADRFVVCDWVVIGGRGRFLSLAWLLRGF